MLRSYFTAAIRNLFRNRAYAAINLCGLALGFMAAILIALFVRDEYSYDRFFPDYQRIYRVSETVQFPNRSPMYRSMTFSYVAAALRREFPEVQIATRLIPTRAVLRHGDGQLGAAAECAARQALNLDSFPSPQTFEGVERHGESLLRGGEQR